MIGFTRNRLSYRVPWRRRYWRWRAKVSAWLRVVLAILACWLLFVMSYLGFAEPIYTLIAVARWSAAAILDAIGLGHWTWTVAVNDGDQPWRSSFIRIDSWHLNQVEAVLASFRMGIAWAATVTLLGLLLALAWWLGKRRAIVRYERQPAATAAQHFAAVDDNRFSLPVKGGERAAAFPDDQEKDHPAVQDEEAADIEGLFQKDENLEKWDEARPRKPLARHKWDYRPC